MSNEDLYLSSESPALELPAKELPALELPALELPDFELSLPSASFQSLSEPPPMGPGTGTAAFLDISFSKIKVLSETFRRSYTVRKTSTHLLE